jgi:hypothetical protein
LLRNERGRQLEAAYLKCTPIRCADRHATSQDRVKICGLMMSMNLSGILVGLVISRQAPLSDIFRTMQSMLGAFAMQIEPPLSVRCRGLLRCSFAKCQPLKRGPSRKAGAQGCQAQSKFQPGLSTRQPLADC